MARSASYSSRMPAPIRVLVAIVVVLALPTGVALAVRISGGHPSPPKITTYTGSDPAGAVTFKLYTFPPKYVHGRPKLVINDFKFAGKCSTAETGVTKGIPVSSHHTFSIDRVNTTIRKIVSGSLHGKSYMHASGTARVVTATCDSGSLKFTAERN
jgi:hypothetical protein